MAHLARIGELRRRVERDPASIAFAQLAEKLSSLGRLWESTEPQGTQPAQAIRAATHLAALEHWLAAILADRALA